MSYSSAYHPFLMIHLKINFFIVAFFFITISSFSQNNKVALKLYNEAVKKLQLNQYQKALDLFNQSIDLKETSDSYVNRAVCKLKLGDQDGYCENLRKAYKLVDREAYSTFWKDCGRIDTTYVDSLGRRCNRSNADLVKLLRTPFDMNNEEELEYLSLSGESVCRAYIIKRDTIYVGGSIIDAPVWLDKEAWMKSVLKILQNYSNTFRLSLNVNSDGSVDEVSVSGLSKEGEFRVVEYTESHPPKFKPAELWGMPIDLRINQKISFD